MGNGEQWRKQDFPQVKPIVYFGERGIPSRFWPDILMDDGTIYRKKRRFGKDQNSIWGELCLRQLGIKLPNVEEVVGYTSTKLRGTSGLRYRPVNVLTRIIWKSILKW